MKKFLALTLAMLMIISCFAACGSKQAEPAPAPEAGGDAVPAKVQAILDAGKIVVGTSADYPPYEFHTMIDGQDTITGIDIAISQYIADKMGVDLEIIDMSFDSLLIAVNNGDFDLVMACLSSNDPERHNAVDFTDDIAYNSQVAVIRKADADVYTTKESLAGQKIGVQRGTTQVDYALEITGQENTLELVKYPDLVTELKAGSIEAVFMESLVAEAFVSGNDDLMVQDIGLSGENTGFAGAVAKGNADFAAYLSDIIAEMHADGTFDAVVKEQCELAAIAE